MRGLLLIIITLALLGFLFLYRVHTSNAYGPDFTVSLYGENGNLIKKWEATGEFKASEIGLTFAFRTPSGERIEVGGGVIVVERVR